MKSKFLRIFAFLAVLLLSLLIVSEFQAIFWTTEYARRQAKEIITKASIDDGRDPKLLSEIHQTEVGGAQWAFEASYEGKPRFFYGVWFSSGVWPELYTGNPDDPTSAAYDHPSVKNTAEQDAAANP